MRKHKSLRGLGVQGGESQLSIGKVPFFYNSQVYELCRYIKHAVAGM